MAKNTAEELKQIPAELMSFINDYCHCCGEGVSTRLEDLYIFISDNGMEGISIYISCVYPEIAVIFVFQDTTFIDYECLIIYLNKKPSGCYNISFINAINLMRRLAHLCKTQQIRHISLY